MPGRVILRATDGPLQGQVHAFDHHQALIFGRAPDCGLVLAIPDGSVSRHHFLLEVNLPAAHVRDLGSRNGTMVDGVRYFGEPAPGAARAGLAGKGPYSGPTPSGDAPAVELKDGSRIEVGRSVFVVEIPALCRVCGEEIRARKARGRAAAAPGPVECARCRKRAVRGPARAAAVDHFVLPRCRNCGRDASGEVASGRLGDYVCRGCRDASAEDPLALVARMLREGERARPKDLPGHRIGRRLSGGGNGVVYEALRAGDGKAVAVKVLIAHAPVSELARRKFHRAVEVLKDCDHPK